MRHSARVAHYSDTCLEKRELASLPAQIRFPDDFMFQLTAPEAKSLLMQFAGENVRGGRRTQPYACTEQGVAVLSSARKADGPGS